MENNERRNYRSLHYALEQFSAFPVRVESGSYRHPPDGFVKTDDIVMSVATMPLHCCGVPGPFLRSVLFSVQVELTVR